MILPQWASILLTTFMAAKETVAQIELDVNDHGPYAIETGVFFQKANAVSDVKTQSAMLPLSRPMIWCPTTTETSRAKSPANSLVHGGKVARCS